MGTIVVPYEGVVALYTTNSTAKIATAVHVLYACVVSKGKCVNSQLFDIPGKQSHETPSKKRKEKKTAINNRGEWSALFKVHPLPSQYRLSG
jgi:hypothetical protein